MDQNGWNHKYVRTVLSAFVFLLGAIEAEAQELRPRILIIGDSVYREPASKIAKRLKDRAEVVFPPFVPGEVRNTQTALKQLDGWLGKGRWDIIHINLGLGDLVHRIPKIHSFRVLSKTAGGVRATNPEQYEKNLDELILKLKTTEAEIIWATTTPIRSAPKGIFELGSEIRYNEIAKRVMQEHSIEVNDMYQHVKEMIDMKRPGSHASDPFQFDKKPIHEPVLDAIEAALGRKI